SQRLPWLSPASAVEQPAGGRRVVGRQYDQAGESLRQGKDLVGGVGKLAPAATAGNLAALHDVRPIGEIPDQQQRRLVAPADQQRHRAGCVAGGGQQNQRAVPHHIQRLGERRQGSIPRPLHAHLPPLQARDLYVLAQVPAPFGSWPGQCSPCGGGHQYLGARELAQTADVILVQV